MKEESFEKIKAVLYYNNEEAAKHLTPYENERRKRWKYCVLKQLDNPLILDSTLVEELVNGCQNGTFEPVTKSTAYRDLAIVRRLVGNVQLATKKWYRMMIVEGVKKAYAIAESKGDGKAMAAALDKLGKYTMADKPDNDFDWEKMIPPDIEPSADADLLENVEKIDNINQRRIELRRLFKSDMKLNATDIVDENG